MRYLTAALVVLGIATRAAAAPVAAAPPARFIPSLDAIVIDGDGADWANRGLAVEALVPVGDTLPSPSSISATARVGYDARGLLALVMVTDDQIEQGDKDKPWEKDSVELFVASGRGERDFYQIAVRPEAGDVHVEDHRKTKELRVKPVEAEAKAKRTASGYAVEARLPWASLGVTPAQGRTVALQIAVNDVDRGGPRAQLIWYPEPGAYEDSAKMYAIKLDRRASPAERVAVAVDAARFPRLRLRVAAASACAGKAVTVRAGAITVKAQLDAGARAVVVLSPIDKPAAIDVTVAGERPQAALPVDFARLKKDALARQRMLCERGVFSGDKLPSCDFEQPAVVEQIAGQYRIETAYYDAAYRKVDRAERPGRYGAIVTVQTADGAYQKRFVTLYRTAEPIAWRRYTLPFDPALPPELGIGAAVAREHKGMVHDLVRDSLAEAMDKRPAAAELLASLRESAAGEPATNRNSPSYRRDLYFYELKHRTGDFKPYAYLVDLPRGYDADAARKWPLVVFLHGAGERGDDLSIVRKHGPAMRAVAGADFPFVLVSLQCPPGDRWLPRAVMDIVREAESRLRIDKSRVYLTGLSMGGYGTWATAAEYPTEFAAIAPVCGGGDPADAARIKGIPAWVFHGKKDPTVPVQRSEEMVAALKKVGADVTFTVYPEAGHDSWTETYDNPKLYEWLLSHERGKTVSRPKDDTRR